MTIPVAPRDGLSRVLFIEELSALIGKTATTIRTCATNAKYVHLIPRPFKMPHSRRLCWYEHEVSPTAQTRRHRCDGDEVTASRVTLLTLLGHELAALDTATVPMSLIEAKRQSVKRILTAIVTRYAIDLTD